MRIRPLHAPLLLAALLATACSSGSGGGPSSRVSFSVGALQVEEDAGTLTLAVVLQAPEAGLAEDVRVLVSDEGSGDATPGSDYTAFAPQELLFPAGSPDGAVQTFELTLIDDALVEGVDETIDLALSDPDNAGLATPRRLQVTVLDAHQATLRFATGATATVDEQTQSHPIPVELVLPAGVSLGVAVSARVADAGTGSATSGADYAAFAARTVEFAAGSPAGSTSAVTIDVLDDSEAENDESVRLALSEPSPGSLLGPVMVHELVITDDDTGTLPFLLVTEGPGGTENTLTDQDELDLGSQTVGAGPNAGTLVRLTNLGQQPLALEAPELGGDHPDDFAIEIESLSNPPPAADEPQVLGADLVAPFLAPADAALDDPRLGLALELDPLELARLDALTAVTLHGFPLPGQGALTLALRRLPLPLAPDAVLAVDGIAQPGGLGAALDGVTLWRGHVLERPGSRVFLAFSPAGAQGFVELPDTPDRLVHVLTEPSTPGQPARVRIAQEGQLGALGRERPAQVCEGVRLPPGAPQPAAPTALTPGTSALTAADCRLALETDWQLYQKLGSVQATTTYVTELVAAVSDRYLTDVQTTLSIAYLGVYSGPGDPWSTPDGPGSTSDMLDEFRDAWNASGWPAPADLAHFVSGASLGGGIAYVDVLCNQSFGYGVSGNINGNIDWSGWTGQKGSFTWDFVVVAHELGHNFGTNHTHAYCPPLDECYSNCNGTTVCSEGTIMSYCHTCAGGMNNIRLEFHPVVADRIRAEVNASCLGASALAGSDWVQYLVRFNPLGSTGARSADLDVQHDAGNHPSPFRLVLSGTATN